MAITAKQFRQSLRKNSTPAEEKLWVALRSRKLGGLKFRRQHTIGIYTVDFFNLETRTIIEVDGDVHFISDDNIKQDKNREKWLIAQGYKVIRFNNVDILKNLDQVLFHLYYNLITVIPPHPGLLL